MNIYTVRDNLKKTIEGKEKYLVEKQKDLDFLTTNLKQSAYVGEEMAYRATIEFLKININELKVILFDVEKCCEQATLASWESNPDRSGGAFTQEEINRGNEWH